MELVDFVEVVARAFDPVRNDYSIAVATELDRVLVSAMPGSVRHLAINLAAHAAGDTLHVDDVERLLRAGLAGYRSLVQIDESVEAARAWAVGERVRFVDVVAVLEHNATADAVELARDLEELVEEEGGRISGSGRAVIVSR